MIWQPLDDNDTLLLSLAVKIQFGFLLSVTHESKIF